MSRILNPAPLWQPDRSEFIDLWHGCTEFDKNQIETKGIRLSHCRVDTDFGCGFYTTTVVRQARDWAWSRYQHWLANPAHKGIPGNQPVVLGFRVRRHGITPRRSSLDDGVDKLLSLHFVTGDHDNEDFWSLVHHCRQSVPADPASGRPAVIHDHRRPPGGWYDLVAGPVAAFWTQRVAMVGADQISFHTPKGIRLLNALIRTRTTTNRYRCDPVTP